MSLFSRLFGGKSSAEPDTAALVDPEEYKGFSILPEPIKDGNVWRVAARITAEVDGTLREHHLIRADTLQDRTEAMTISAAKARQMIDEQGRTLFR